MWPMIGAHRDRAQWLLTAAAPLKLAAAVSQRAA